MATIRYDGEWQRLHQRLCGIARRRAALDAEEARCLREAHEVKLWQRFGYAHINEYLERELGYSPQVGVERLRIAHALAELPMIEESLAEGRLPYSAVRELTRVATTETEQAWLDKACGKTLREIEQMVSGKKRGDRPEDLPDPELVTRVLRLELTPAAFALFRQAQSAMADEHGQHLDDSTLMEILCRRAMEPSGIADRPPYQIAITVCDACGRGWQNGSGREIEISGDVVERARCDAEEIGPLDAQQPERVTAAVTPRLRRQVLARDHHRCTVPGCRSARNLDLHHIEYRRVGGGNEISNLTTLCSGHHKCLHEGLLMVRGKAPDELEFTWRNPSRERPCSVVRRALPSPASPAPSVTARCSPRDDVALTNSTPSMIARRSHAGGDVPPASPAPSVIARRSPRDDAAPTNSAPSLTPRCSPQDDAPPASPALSMTARRSPRDDAPPASPASSLTAARSTRGDAPPVSMCNSQGVAHHHREYGSDPTSSAEIDEDACTALVTAGYKAREARAAVARARLHVRSDATLDQMVREALRRCVSSDAGPLVAR